MKLLNNLKLMDVTFPEEVIEGYAAKHKELRTALTKWGQKER